MSFKGGVSGTVHSFTSLTIAPKVKDLPPPEIMPSLTLKVLTSTPSNSAALFFNISRMVAANSRKGCHKPEIELLPPVENGSIFPVEVWA